MSAPVVIVLWCRDGVQQNLTDGFVAAMRRRNKKYGNHPRCHGLLSCSRVTHLWHDESVGIDQEPSFTSKSNYEENMAKTLPENDGNDLIVGVFTKTPYTAILLPVTVTTFNSHSHHLPHTTVFKELSFLCFHKVQA